MAKSLTEMAVEIAAAQASHAKMSPEEIDKFLEVTFQRLKEMKENEEGKVEKVPSQVTPEVDPFKSVQRNKVICLECGQEFRQLTNAHLKSHGLTAKEYRKKWGLPARYPLVAKALVAKRRKLAKERGLGERLKKAREEKRASK
jgi:predicted transcriptional regulator